MSMNYQRSYSYYSNRSFGQRLLAAIALLLFISLFFYLSWQINKLLFIISPIFIVIALVLHSPVVGNHIKSIGLRFKQGLFGGLFNVAIQLIGLPIVSIGLAFKAWAYKKFGKIQDQMVGGTNTEEGYTQYEEIPNDDRFDLNQERKSSEKKSATKENSQQNHYDDLFV